MSCILYLHSLAKLIGELIPCVYLHNEIALLLGSSFHEGLDCFLSAHFLAEEPLLGGRVEVVAGRAGGGFEECWQEGEGG